MKAQNTKFRVSERIDFHGNEAVRQRISRSLDELFAPNKSALKKGDSISRTGYSENSFLLKEIRRIEESNTNLERELINFYPIDEGKYLLKIIVKENSNLRAIFSLIAELDGGKVSYSSPLTYHTRFWKEKTIGDVQYFYQDSLNIKTATDFDKKSKQIAKKFGITPKKLKYYKCSNYEEVQRVLGIDFDSVSAGTVQSSEAFENTIITGVNSENFEHDVFHMYIETKFPDGKDRNFIAEEGYANSIADAYYAKKNGEIISRKELVLYLKEYLEKNPATDLLELFQKDPRVFHQLSDQVSNEVFSQLSVKSTITSLICDEVEHKKGFEGLTKLLRSGQGQEAFFDSIAKSIGFDKLNFDNRVKKLISDFDE